MKLLTKSADPLQILSSTKLVLENAESVNLNETAIPAISRLISERIKKGLYTPKGEFGAKGDYLKDIQLIFIENTINFSFWSDLNKPQWEIEWPAGTKLKGGWYGLKTAFERELEINDNFLNSDYLKNITVDQLGNILRSSNSTEISMLQERVKNLNEVGKVLSDKYKRHFINILEQANFDAVQIAKILYSDFECYKDISQYNGHDVYILKGAQIVANDISYLENNYNKKKINNLGNLTAFANYTLPQILRHFSVIQYNEKLASKIHDQVSILKDSKEEIEIRSATIWAVELIRQSLVQFSAPQIDNAIWLLSREIKASLKPYHRTRTIFY